MRIAREGYPFIIGTLVPGVLLTALYPIHHLSSVFIVGILLMVFGLACMGFFRNPVRNIPAADKILLSPADGKVLQVVEVDDEYVGPGFRVDIFLSVLDVHVNRIPTSGRIDFVKYRAGKFFSAFKDKASEDNERTDIGINGTWGKFKVAQIAGSIARRIVCHLREADEVEAGQLYGMIRFGSRTELTFSKRYRPCVKPGQRVRGGETIVGELEADA